MDYLNDILNSNASDIGLKLKEYNDIILNEMITLNNNKDFDMLFEKFLENKKLCRLLTDKISSPEENEVYQIGVLRGIVIMFDYLLCVECKNNYCKGEINEK